MPHLENNVLQHLAPSSNPSILSNPSSVVLSEPESQAVGNISTLGRKTAQWHCGFWGFVEAMLRNTNPRDQDQGGHP